MTSTARRVEVQLASAGKRKQQINRLPTGVDVCTIGDKFGGRSLLLKAAEVQAIRVFLGRGV
jgi:hypothetical protein